MAATIDQGKQRWIVISAAFAAFMATLDGNIVNISLPSIAKYFQVSITQVVQVALLYLLILTSTLLIFGRLIDKSGSKKIFVLGYLGFILGSLFSGLAPTFTALLLARCLQGLGAAMLITTVFTLVSEHIPADRRGWAFGLLATAAAAGVMIGAPLGGFITGFFSWHGIFLINVPIGILALYIALRVLPPSQAKPAKAGARFDYLGALLSFTAPAGLIYALNNGQKAGWSSAPIIGAFLVSVLSVLVLYWWEKKASEPIVDLSLFRVPDFSLVNVSNLLVFLVLAGNAFAMPFYLQYVKGLSVEAAGLVLMTNSFVYMLAGPLAGRLSDKIRPKILCLLGAGSGCLAVLTFAFTLSRQGMAATFVLLVWLALSNGFFVSPNNNEVMALAPADKKGSASGIFRMISNLGLIAGVLLFEVVYSASLPTGTPPGQRPPAAEMMVGFHNVYLFAAGVLFLAAVLTFIEKGQSRPGAKTGDVSL